MRRKLFQNRTYWGTHRYDSNPIASEHGPSVEYIERKKDDPDIDKLIAVATEILHLSHHGDQQFIKCLRGNDAAQLRLAMVKLNGVFREDVDDE